ncbi:MAG: DUF5696 domain-containing protein [Defluviitaleaceae bacterium]|nr:DUF5696 domain-containing protein [Defluviitaleaceae bacterium]
MLKNWILQRIGTIITLVVLGIFVIWGFVSINNAIAASPGRVTWSYTPPESNVDSEDTGEYVQISESGNAVLMFNHARGTIRVVDTTNGHVWHSIVNDEIYDIGRLNPVWTAYLQSPIVVEFNNLQHRDAPPVRLFTYRDMGYLQTELIPGGVSVTYGFLSHGLFVTVEYTLEDGVLVVRVPWEKIREESNFAVTSMEIMPFFGAASNYVQGYMLYPDAGGGITRFDMADTRPAIIGPGMWFTYSHRTVDMVNFMFPDQYLRHTAALPVLGIKHDNNAFLAAITQGEENAGIIADPSGRVVHLNRAFFEIHTRNIFNVDLHNITVGGLGALGRTVQRIDRDIIQNDREIKYFFLSGDDATYSGMARVYREYLISTGQLTNSIEPGSNIPLALNIIMGATEPQMLLDSYITMTSFEQVEYILERLRQGGVYDVNAVLGSWTRGGDTPPRYWPPARQLGGTRGLRGLDNYLNNHPNFNVFLANNFIFASRATGGFSSRADVVYNGTNIPLSFQTSNTTLHLLNPAVSQSRHRSFMNRLSPFENINIAFINEGQIIYNDYNARAPFTKAETVQVWESMFEESANQVNRVAARGLNQYTFRNVDFLYQVPVRGFGLAITDEFVPFVHMVLSGMIPLSAEPANLSYDLNVQMLRWIEYGLLPTFTITYEDSIRLMETSYSWLFTSAFDTWESRILDVYHEFANNFSDVFGRQMISHTRLSRDIVRVEYDNNIVIYLNYSGDTVTVGNVTIPPVGYVIVRGGV